MDVDLELATKPILIILKIVHSQLAKHVAPRILDETLARIVKPALQEIGEDIQNLKLKDLKLSQDKMQSTLVKLEDKFAGEEDKSETMIKKLSEDIESELKSAQESAMSGLHSGLGSVEQIDCIKIILMTECFLVLNILSSLHEIKPKEEEMFASMLKIAQATCEIKLKQLNEVKEVREYLSRKFAPESVHKLRLPTTLSTFDSSALAREVIAINFQVHFFIEHWKEKLSSRSPKTNKKKARSSKIEKTRTERYSFPGAKAHESSEISTVECSILSVDNVDCIAAAICVIKQDADLAQMLEDYLLTFDNVEAVRRISGIKEFLRQNKGVQKAFEKGKVKIANNDGNHSGPLLYLNRLAVVSTMERMFTNQTSVGTDGETAIVVGSNIELVPRPIEKLSLDWSPTCKLRANTV